MNLFRCKSKLNYVYHLISVFLGVEKIVSELSFQEGSVYNSEMECINLEQQSETEPLDVKLDQGDDKSESHYSLPPMVSNVNGQVQASIELIKTAFFCQKFMTIKSYSDFCFI